MKPLQSQKQRSLKIGCSTVILTYVDHQLLISGVLPLAIVVIPHAGPAIWTIAPEDRSPRWIQHRQDSISAITTGVDLLFPLGLRWLLICRLFGLEQATPVADPLRIPAFVYVLTDSSDYYWDMSKHRLRDCLILNLTGFGSKLQKILLSTPDGVVDSVLQHLSELTPPISTHLVKEIFIPILAEPSFLPLRKVEVAMVVGRKELIECFFFDSPLLHEALEHWFWEDSHGRIKVFWQDVLVVLAPILDLKLAEFHVGPIAF
jgi:hypothetical protein